MRLEHVKIDGYKRLADTGFYVNRKLVALVGPNEAGKSSILNLLYSFESRNPLQQSERTRSTLATDDDAPVGRLTFRLSDSDKAELAGISLEEPPDVLILVKSADGDVLWELEPQPRYASALASDANAGLSAILAALTKVGSRLKVSVPIADDATESRDLVAESNAFIAALGDHPFPNRALKTDQWETLFHVRDSWDALNGLHHVKKAWSAVASYYDDEVTQKEAAERVFTILDGRTPKFRLFSDSDRGLRDSYDLAEFSTTADLPAVLARLLTFGGLSLERMRAIAADEPQAETEIDQANIKIAEKFSERWKQSKVSLQLKIEGTIMKVFVIDLEHGGRAFFSERSDGLRMFIALSLFLESYQETQPPILLIDEADLHLHIDAQADLIEMLSGFDGVTQAIYTTHSPACLPTDLGTGVRFVIPDPARGRESVVQGSFWGRQAEQTGFSLLPMLYMMGAQSAAFSRLRNALIVEGPTETVLLPSLLRFANGVDDLAYQVVPGLAQLNDESYSDISSIAVKVGYLVDGDAGGDSLLTRLRVLHVQEGSLLQLDRGTAIEDLLDPALYVKIVNLHLTEGSRQLAVADVTGGPAKPLVKKWAARNGVKVPGAIAIAETLLTRLEQREDVLKLTDAAIIRLRDVHERMMSVVAG